MPLILIRNDITKVKADAIVNAANASLLGGGGMDGAIHRAAGPQLLEECKTLHGCEPGQAKLTKGYLLPCKYVIHTVGPVWIDGSHGERQTLASCYFSSLALAARYGCCSTAVGLISAGAYGCPTQESFEIATKTIETFLQTHEMTVYLVLFDRVAYGVGLAHYKQIAAYIDDCYARTELLRRSALLNEVLPTAQGAQKRVTGAAHATSKPTLSDAVSMLDESFSQMLLRKISEKQLSDSACYKKANIDRKLFSKIRCDVLYKPRKTTALAFAVALELPMNETLALLRTAGYTLSHSSKFDVIVEYFIQNGNYDIYQINEALFAFDQALLGA